MLQDTLISVRENLKKSSVINEKRINCLINNMQLWKVGNIIYPSRIKSLLHISFKETYQVLDIIEEMGILTYNYQIYCSQCERFLDMPMLSSLNQFPEELFCDENHRLNALEDTVLVYKVVRDE